MDNTIKESSPWRKIFKNIKKKSASVDTSDVTSPSSSGLAEHEASNIDIADKLDSISMCNDQQIPSTSNYLSNVSVNPNGENNYRELFEKIEATIERLTLNDNNQDKGLFDEIQIILICFKLLGKIPELTDLQCFLIDSHMEIESNYWKEVGESMKPKLSTLKRFKNLAFSVLGKVEDPPPVKKINTDGELIHKYLRRKQKLIDRSLSILWGKIVSEYAITCKHILIRIAYNMDYFLPAEDDKDRTEVSMKTYQLFDLIEMFETKFKKLNEAFENMDSIFQNNNESIYSSTNPESSMNKSQTSTDIQVKQQDSYEALTQKRKELKQEVEDISASIRKIINKVESVTVDKLTKVFQEFIIED
ncbi:hypothetical protein G9C98_005812 [Cotesia typhae]|uniref:Uncharacterized protein n=1 Tax=Cotesia typhae TaxID=2053667 RepID=A0A8J5QSH7_9HYME|nr:hypothetical protein G9C98_005812 [Cotesia typhae]